MAQSDDLIGMRFGDYVLEEFSKFSSVGRIYQAIDSNLLRPAAVKIIDLGHLPEYAQDTFWDRLRTEAKVLGRFEHPNIVYIYQYGQLNSETLTLGFIAMQLIDGQTVDALIQRANQAALRFPGDVVLSIIYDVASALDYMHERGIVHHGVMASSITVTDMGKAMLTDFGTALETGTDISQAHLSTPDYMAPELAISPAAASSQSDLYSLAVVLYELLTGRVPFQAQAGANVTSQHLSTPPPAPRSLNPDIPESVESVVLRALEKRPEARYETGADLYQALSHAYVSSGGVSVDQISHATTAAFVEQLQTVQLSWSDQAANAGTIFVSYSRKDWTDYVEPMITHLRNAGFSVWVDQHLLRGGQDWLDEINYALDDCSTMILCVSPDAMESRYVKMEYRYFFDENKPIVPLMCREAKLPAELRRIQYLPYGDHGVLLNTLKVLLKI